MTDGDGIDRRQKRAIDRLVREFTKLRGDRLSGAVERLLEVKCNYQGGAPDDWSHQDVAGVLLDFHPAKVILEPDELPQVVPAAAALMRFLAERHPAQAEQLEFAAEGAELMADEFVSAMADESKWSVGKRMWSAAQAEGVDFDDQRAVDVWMEAFNQRPRAERDQVLGTHGEPPLPGLMFPRKALPPMTMPTKGELDEALDEAVMLHQLMTLVRYVDNECAVGEMGEFTSEDTAELVDLLGTDDLPDGAGDPSADDAPTSDQMAGLDLLYQVALVAGLLTLVDPGDTVAPGGWAHLADEVSIDLAEAAFRAMVLDVGPAESGEREGRYGFGWFVEEIDNQMLSLLLRLGQDGETAMVDEVAAHIWAALEDGYDWDAFAKFERFDKNNLDFYRRLVADDTRYALHRYAELGIVRVVDEQEIVETTGGSRRTGGRVELDRLGKVLVNRLVAESSGGPPIGSLKHLDAADLLRAAADIPDGLAEAELDNWLAAGDETAVQRMIEAMAVVSPLERHGAYHALLRLDPENTPTCEQFEEAGLGDVALVFGVDTERFSPEVYELGNDPESWVGLVATVADLWGAEVAATAWAEQAAGAGGLTAMLEQAWRVGGDNTETALGAVGSSHPDKKTAKAARKALFKFRSAG